MIAILLIAIVVLFLIGVPIAFAIGAGATIAILWEGTLPVSIVAQRMFFGLDSWLLMAIPLFMLAGQLMASGGMSSRLVAFTTELFGFIRGSLGFVCIAASMTFAGVSGSSTADTAAVGSILLPLMKERGYDMRFATALQAAAGSIGPVIPPSLLMILIGFTTNTSVSALFLGGIVPGLLIGLGLMVVTYVHAARGGDAYLGTRTHVDLRRVARAGLVAAPALGMPVIILVGIVGGIFTTTEAAVVAVVYGLVVGMFVYREITVRDLPGIITRAAELATVIMFIQTTAFLFAWLITVHQVPALLAQAFAAWLTPGSTNLEVSGPFGSGYELVPVGADWTSSENILGYADALDHSRYVRTQALDILLRARERPRLPHFLILDEMNLSHVERYFSDFLSAIEANESLRLYSDTSAERDGVPSSIVLPPNLFVVGTVNVDETTYMFSPKVLDRANVIEFRVGSEQMMGFLEDPKGIQLEQLAGQGVRFAEAFVDASQHPAKLEAVDRQKLRDVSMLFFDVLEQHGAEFGFRIANEMSRFISFHRRLSTEAWSFEEAMDAQVVQKLLPKLHGSRRRLEPLLCGLAALCYYPHEWKAENATVTLSSVDELRTKAAQFASLAEPNLHPLARNDLGAYLLPKDQAHFSLAYDKLVRMLRALEENGFTSFAEA